MDKCALCTELSKNAKISDDSVQKPLAASFNRWIRWMNDRLKPNYGTRGLSKSAGAYFAANPGGVGEFDFNSVAPPEPAEGTEVVIDPWN
jgi:hypothetical protein